MLIRTLRTTPISTRATLYLRGLRSLGVVVGDLTTAQLSGDAWTPDQEQPACLASWEGADARKLVAAIALWPASNEKADLHQS
jgi:hypothetical protein